MINTILVEDDLYIQKHFAERLKSNDVFRLVGVYRDAFEAERNCNSSIQAYSYGCTNSAQTLRPCRRRAN